MRSPAIELFVQSPTSRVAARRTGLWRRVHWPRVFGLALILGAWPAILFVVSRVF